MRLWLILILLALAPWVAPTVSERVRARRLQRFLDKAEAYGNTLLAQGRDHSRPYASMTTSGHLQ